jgi:toxin FitB
VSEGEEAPKTIRYIAEIRYGIERLAAVDRSRKRLEAWRANELRPWLSDRRLEVDEDVLVIWRRLVEEGKAMRRTFPQPDLFIAATAILHDLCVVTCSVDDFLRRGVSLLNPWTDAHPRFSERAIRRRPEQAGDAEVQPKVYTIAPERPFLATLRTDCSG